MLCDLKENSKPQCDEYWPKTIGTCFEWPRGLENKELRVTLESENKLEQKRTERTFTVERIMGEITEKKKVTQIQVIFYISFCFYLFFLVFFSFLILSENIFFFILCLSNSFWF